MAPKNHTVLIGLACVVLIALASGLGYFMVRGSGTAKAPPVTTGGDVAAGAAVQAAHDGPTPKTNTPVLTPTNVAATPAKAELDDWRILQSGTTVEQTGAKIHIFGTNTADGWGHENGVSGNLAYPVQDFEISTDFMMPQFKGPGNALVMLQVREANASQVTLQYYVQGSCYMLRWWTSSGEEFARTTLPKFGDEATKSHRLRLKYEAATHVSTGWVDDKLIGTVDFELKSNVRFLLGAATDKKGNDIDLYFDHTTLSLGGNTGVKLE